MIALGCDHGGYELKQEIIKYLEENNIEYKDFGCDSTDSTDYPIYAKRVAIAIQNGDCEKGILICGTGIGISITANKFKGIRAALCSDCFSAEATRLHNNANILAMGGRVVGPGLAVKIVDTFLNTPFSEEERHIRRIKQIEEDTDITDAYPEIYKQGRFLRWLYISKNVRIIFPGTSILWEWQCSPECVPRIRIHRWVPVLSAMITRFFPWVIMDFQRAAQMMNFRGHVKEIRLTPNICM